jgi:hypothetical protein
MAEWLREGEVPTSTSAAAAADGGGGGRDSSLSSGVQEQEEGSPAAAPAPAPATFDSVKELLKNAGFDMGNFPAELFSKAEQVPAANGPRGDGAAAAAAVAATAEGDGDVGRSGHGEVGAERPSTNGWVTISDRELD